ncbi:TIR-like protein FxsC [Kitasatospora phosalacinea]|uniref:TIR-like protein FxsC n=1 Tax=Kitasatospora phosalacinea TaxID=2065 RepID=UPI0035D5680E
MSELLTRALDVLRAAGVDLTHDELLDVLWLSTRLPTGPDAPLAAHRPAPDGGPDDAPRHPDDERPPDQEDGPGEPRPRLPLHSAAADPDRGRGRSPAAPADAVLVPGPKALDGQLLLGRALRPLNRRRPAPRDSEVDEAATVASWAEEGLPTVVLRNATEPWLDCVLAVDDGVSMLLWQRLVVELGRILTRTGGFRTVRTVGLRHQDGGGVLVGAAPFDRTGRTMPGASLRDPTGRTLVLVVTDGVADAWRDGRMRTALDRWAAVGPTAVLHTLPRRLWPAGALDAASHRIRVPGPGGPNTGWRVDGRPAHREPPVPVLELTPAYLADWAALLAAQNEEVRLDLLVRADPRPAPLARRHLPPLARLDRFRAAASPGAYRLAAHFAVLAPLSIPVMRLVRDAVAADTEIGTAMLTEVLLGGLMRPWEAEPAEVPPPWRQFDFDSEVRAALSEALPSAELRQVRRAVNRQIDRLAGHAPEFPAWMGGSGPADKALRGAPFGSRPAGATAPGSSAPEPDAPGSIALEAEAPEPAAPGPAVPGSSAPEPSAPGSIVSEAEAPEPAVPGSIASEAELPSPAVPEVSFPEPAAPAAAAPASPPPEPPLAEAEAPPEESFPPPVVIPEPPAFPPSPSPAPSSATGARPPGRPAGSRPYFFLSYAHTPRIDTRGAADPNMWVAKLYQDLCEAILQITDAPPGQPVGFMDRSMHQGQKWAERLSHELATCRVFVPLYSPRYFRSEACGREWHLFTRRPVYQRRPTAERMTGIVPALWVSTEHLRLPRVAGELQFNHDSFGAEYAAEGLYALMKLTSFTSQYHTAVWRLARRIVDVAEQTVIPIGQELDFESQPSAFESPDPADQVHILVFSYRERELPPQRSAFWYGEQRTDWQPYRSASSRPLAQDAADIARSMGFQPTVREFEEVAEQLLAGERPERPCVLLVDRWAFLDGRRAEALRRLDRRNLGPVAVIEPWNREDQQSRDHERMLDELGDDLLSVSRSTLNKPSLQPRSTAPGSIEEFRGELERAVMRACTAHEGRPVRRPSVDGPATGP